MNNKIKNIVVTVAFVLFMAIFVGQCVAAYFSPVSFSSSERRPLAQFPDKITWQGIVDKTVIDDFEDYTVDQFPLREFFRRVKAKFQFGVLGLKENNGYAVEDGYIAKIEPQFNNENINISKEKDICLKLFEFVLFCCIIVLLEFKPNPINMLAKK